MFGNKLVTKISSSGFSVPQTLYDAIFLFSWTTHFNFCCDKASYFLFKHKIVHKLSVDTEYLITPVNKSLFEILNRHSTDLIRKFIFIYQRTYHIYAAWKLVGWVSIQINRLGGLWWVAGKKQAFRKQKQVFFHY